MEECIASLGLEEDNINTLYNKSHYPFEDMLQVHVKGAHSEQLDKPDHKHIPYEMMSIVIIGELCHLTVYNDGNLKTPNKIVRST